MPSKEMTYGLVLPGEFHTNGIKRVFALPEVHTEYFVAVVLKGNKERKHGYTYLNAEDNSVISAFVPIEIGDLRVFATHRGVQVFRIKEINTKNKLNLYVYAGLEETRIKIDRITKDMFCTIKGNVVKYFPLQKSSGYLIRYPVYQETEPEEE